ncbi:DNA-packaging protein [Tsuneonella sp. SYSU-LHT278]|uniref:DNA-packaging protein n=1 Tax=Tsuneonella sediminis TaxID=3416089 RepID=UPI003F7A2317
MTARTDLLRALLDCPQENRPAELRKLSEIEQRELRYFWKLWARPEQLPPAGDWRTWLISAGRGLGKTRAGAEWVREYARRHPDCRIALVGASLGEVRSVMVEGESGLLAVCPPENLPVFEPSLKRLSWGNGAQAFLYSAAEPESLRGPQHEICWADELGKWETVSNRAQRAWDNLLLGLRLGERPRVCVTTTPRSVPLMRALFEGREDGSVAVSGGTSLDNAYNLPSRYVADMSRLYRGSALGRQEIHGELIEEVEGALWSRALLERCRADGTQEPVRTRTVVGIDPPAGERGDACGIVVAALLEDGNAIVLADASVEKASPERWARVAASTARAWQVDRVVAEANQGGAMVRAVLRAADEVLPVTLVHASRGKVARAEPVAALYESGRVKHAAMFAQLEDQMCGLLAGGRYEGPGRSPDRADALVWALTDLMLGRIKGPKVRAL